LIIRTSITFPPLSYDLKSGGRWTHDIDMRSAPWTQGNTWY